MKNKTIYFFLMSFLLSCSSLVERKSSYLKLFDLGIYQHDILVHLNDGRNIKLTGFNSITKESFKVIGLSPVGSTILSYIRDENSEHLYYEKRVLPLSEFKLKAILNVIEGMYSLKDDICKGLVCSYAVFGETIILNRVLDGRITSIEFNSERIKLFIKVKKYIKNKTTEF